MSTTPESPIELQNHPQFLPRYPFNNIVFLHEALTHSFDSCASTRHLANGNVTCQKEKMWRFKTLGISVLKLLCHEQALRQNEPTCSEGVLTDTVKKLMSTDTLKLIGRRLELHRYIEVGRGFPKHDVENLYPDVIKAIFGAFYVDAGLYEEISSESPLLKTRILFLKFWVGTPDFVPPLGGVFKRSQIKTCFSNETYSDLGNYVRNEYDLDSLFDRIGYKFNNYAYFVEAMTHGSAKQTLGALVSDYQRFEFLGDAVYELVICEYLYWYYLNDHDETLFSKIGLDKFTSKEFQKTIAENVVGLRPYILKTSSVKINDTQDFLESLIGAIFVDSELLLGSTRKVIINLCKKGAVDISDGGGAKFPNSIMKVHEMRGKPVPTWIDELRGTYDLLFIKLKFTIANVNRFETEWRYFAPSYEMHVTTLENAKEAATRKITNRFRNRKDEYNRLKVARLTPHGVAATMLLNQDKRHDDDFKCDDNPILESSGSFNSGRRNNRVRSESKEEVTAEDNKITNNNPRRTSMMSVIIMITCVGIAMYLYTVVNNVKLKK